MFDTLSFYLKKDIMQKNIEEIFFSSAKDKNLNKELQSKFWYNVKRVSTLTPFFGDTVLVFLDTTKMDVKILEKVLKILEENQYLKLILKNTSKELFDYLNLCGREMKNLNFYKPPNWLLALHLKMYLAKDIDGYAFKAFSLRMKRQWKYLDDYIHILNTDDCDIVRLKDIERLVPKAEPIDFHCILSTLLLGENYKKTMIHLSNYRFARKFLTTELRNKIEMLIKIKKDMNTAVFNSESLEEYAKNNNISNWELEKYYESILKRVSLEWLYKIKYNIIFKESSVLEMILASSGLYERM